MKQFLFCLLENRKSDWALEMKWCLYNSNTFSVSRLIYFPIVDIKFFLVVQSVDIHYMYDMSSSSSFSLFVKQCHNFGYLVFQDSFHKHVIYSFSHSFLLTHLKVEFKIIFPQLEQVQISNLSSRIIIAAKCSDFRLSHISMLIRRANYEM